MGRILISLTVSKKRRASLQERWEIPLEKAIYMPSNICSATQQPQHKSRGMSNIICINVILLKINERAKNPLGSQLLMIQGLICYRLVSCSVDHDNWNLHVEQYLCFVQLWKEVHLTWHLEKWNLFIYRHITAFIGISLVILTKCIIAFLLIYNLPKRN